MEERHFFPKSKAVNYDLAATELNFYPRIMTQAETATMASAVLDKCLHYDLILAKVLPVMDPVGYRDQPHTRIMADYAAMQKWQRELSRNRLSGHDLRLAANQVCSLNSKYNLALCKFMYSKFQEFKTVYYPSMQQYYEAYYANHERVPNGVMRAFMSNYRKYCHFLKNLDLESAIFAEENPYVADTRLRREGLEDLVHIMAYDLVRLEHYQEKLSKQTKVLDRANGILRTDHSSAQQYLISNNPRQRKRLLESLATVHANMDEQFYQPISTTNEVGKIWQKLQSHSQALPPVIERKQFFSETLPIKQHWWSCLLPKKEQRRTRVEVVTEPLDNHNSTGSTSKSWWQRLTGKLFPKRQALEKKIVTSDTLLTTPGAQQQVIGKLLNHCKAEGAFWGLDNYETESLARLAKPTVDFLYRQYHKMMLGDPSAVNAAKIRSKVQELQQLFPNQAMDRSQSPVNLRNFVNSTNELFTNLHLTEAEFREYKNLLRYQELKNLEPSPSAVLMPSSKVSIRTSKEKQSASSAYLVPLSNQKTTVNVQLENDKRKHLAPISNTKTMVQPHPIPLAPISKAKTMAQPQPIPQSTAAQSVRLVASPISYCSTSVSNRQHSPQHLRPFVACRAQLCPTPIKAEVII